MESGEDVVQFVLDGLAPSEPGCGNEPVNFRDIVGFRFLVNPVSPNRDRVMGQFFLRGKQYSAQTSTKWSF